MVATFTPPLITRSAPWSGSPPAVAVVPVVPAVRRRPAVQAVRAARAVTVLPAPSLLVTAPMALLVLPVVTVARVAPVVFRSGVSAVPVVTPVPVVTVAVAPLTARTVVTAAMVVPRAVAVPVVPAVRRGRVPVVRADLVVTPGPRALELPVPRVRPARSCRATVAKVVPAVSAVLAEMVVLLEPVVYPLLLRAGPRARRARSAWLLLAASVVLVLPVVRGSTPQV